MTIYIETNQTSKGRKQKKKQKMNLPIDTISEVSLLELAESELTQVDDLAMANVKVVDREVEVVGFCWLVAALVELFVTVK